MDKMAALNDPNFVYVFATASFSQKGLLNF